MFWVRNSWLDDGVASPMLSGLGLEAETATNP